MRNINILWIRLTELKCKMLSVADSLTSLVILPVLHLALRESNQDPNTVRSHRL